MLLSPGIHKLNLGWGQKLKGNQARDPEVVG